MFRSKTSLSKLEQLVMDVVWKRTAATSEDVREELATRHPMKESTARTILTRLEVKGYVTHAVDGRTNVYRAQEAKQSVAAGAVRQIIDRLCGGSVEQLLVGMVDDQVIGEKELTRLAQKIAKRRAAK